MLKTLSSVACYITVFFAPITTICQGSSDDQCKWGWSDDDPHVYWVNMDKSSTRKVSMSALLNKVSGSSHHHRVRGITLQEIYIPSDVESTWNSYNAIYDTEKYPDRAVLSNSSYKVVVSSLFGRRKANRLKELGCTISHLMAIREAIYDTRSKSKYAIITEDDVQFPFAVNWNALIDSAPKDFGILMLFNSNKDTFHQQWTHYLNAVKKSGDPGKANLWVEKWPGQPSAYWSTCAYLINKQVVKPMVDGILQTRNGVDDVKIIAGVVSPCVPKHSPCCLNNTGDAKKFVYSKVSPCIWSPKGYQADAYLYAMAKTYVLTVPIIVNGAGGNESTFHQDHVESIHEESFKRMREASNLMLSGQVKAPDFMKAACPGKLLPTNSMKVDRTTVYNFKNWKKSGIEVFLVNIDTDKRQRQEMVQHLSNIGNVIVVEAYDADEVYIPSELQVDWMNCPAPVAVETILYNDLVQAAAAVRNTVPSVRTLPLKSQYYPVDRLRHPTSTSTSTSIGGKMSPNWFAPVPYRAIVSALCGRGDDKLPMFHLTATLTHLLAIRQAVYSPTATSRYALIVEDNVNILFDVDVEKLAAAAPKGFGILQLSNANDRVERYWIKYLREHNMWLESANKGSDHAFASAAYLIDRDVLKPVINAIIREVTVGQWAGYAFKIIAGHPRPCRPAQCCHFFKFQAKAPCILAQQGFKPYTYLFNLVPSYFPTLPVATVGLNNTLSTYRQTMMKAEGLIGLGKEVASQRRVMDEMFGGTNKLPEYLTPGCNRPLEEIK